jgi:hypothetical protein
MTPPHTTRHHDSDVRVHFDLKAQSITVVATTSFALTPLESWSVVYRPGKAG